MTTQKDYENGMTREDYLLGELYLKEIEKEIKRRQSPTRQAFKALGESFYWTFRGLYWTFRALKSRTILFFIKTFHLE